MRLLARRAALLLGAVMAVGIASAAGATRVAAGPSASSSSPSLSPSSGSSGSFVSSLPNGEPTAPIRLALIEGLSGPLGNGGEAVFRNLVWATERVNARGGVRLPGGARRLELVRFDSKGSVEESLSMLRAATDQGIPVVLQGNSSAVAAR